MADKEQEKGFVIKDRRRFAEGTETEENEQGPQPEAASAEGEQRSASPEEVSDRQEEQARGPLPEVTLATFIFSLSSSALVHLGEIPEPETNRTLVDLPIAKQIIDTLGMLQEKTKGNLDQDEERLLKSVLYDLRMRYIQKSDK
ncbi:MAG TPA: DUF1844 domain-containing protein [Deltaproteobacteria bacterium]|jgi:hypothetical protein|nr:DUF1844 domain-containing protein [Deltaproteobacteria bacterium]HIJ76230.1 DUF1844 domain-containing protein [Deltaproteobacteria bacterium]